MKRFALIMLGAGLLVSTTALGQNLDERIRYVMNKRAQQEAQNTSKSHMLSVLLYSDVTVEFEDTTARDAINYLQTVLNINIIGRYNDDRNAYSGIDPDTEININIQQKPALTALEMVLDACASELDEPCTWQLRNGYVEVGTKERLSAPNAREIRYYPIRDLLFEPPMFDNAPELDIESALNQGGQQGGFGGGGGGGGGGGFGGGGGGGGGGAGGSGGGGALFDTPGDAGERVPEEERAQQIVDLIQEIVEPDAWLDIASIRYYQGTLIVRAPDYVHRQIDGYPYATGPVGQHAGSVQRRYVTFSGGVSNVSVTGLERSAPASGTAGTGGGSGRTASSDNASEAKQDD
jgi:uncharacterized membrane protein YgcG